MTEQERREKAMIEKVLSDEQIKIANDVNEFAKLQKVGISVCYADALYYAGYRKEEDVQKEIINELINYAKDETIIWEARYEITTICCILAEKFGVEVKE